VQDPGGAFVVLLSVFVVILQDPGGRCCGKSLGPALTTKTCSSVFTIERSVLLRALLRKDTYTDSRCGKTVTTQIAFRSKEVCAAAVFKIWLFGVESAVEEKG